MSQILCMKSTHATIEAALFPETVSEGWRSSTQNRRERAMFLHWFRGIPRVWEFSSGIGFSLHRTSFWERYLDLLN